MEKSGPIRTACELFQGFVAQWDDRPYHHPTKDPRERDYLQYYLLHWLEKGDAIPATGGKFEIYERAVIDIADAVMQGAVKLDYRGTPEADYADRYERRVTGIHDPRFAAKDALDKTHYDVTMFWRTHAPDEISPPFSEDES